MDQDAVISVSQPELAADRRSPARPILAVSLAVFRGDRVLLAQRARAPLAGLFSLPGGLVEVGESLTEAALRELREEVEVSARVIGFNRHVEVVERDGEGRMRMHFVIASFVGEWIAGAGTTGPEAAAVVWLRPDEASSLATTAGLLPVLDGAKAIYEGWVGRETRTSGKIGAVHSVSQPG